MFYAHAFFAMQVLGSPELTAHTFYCSSAAVTGRVYPRYGIHEISEMDDREPYKV